MLIIVKLMNNARIFNQISQDLLARKWVHLSSHLYVKYLAGTDFLMIQLSGSRITARITSRNETGTDGTEIWVLLVVDDRAGDVVVMLSRRCVERYFLEMRHNNPFRWEGKARIQDSIEIAKIDKAWPYLLRILSAAEDMYRVSQPSARPPAIALCRLFISQPDQEFE
jgi:hypothetical protein